MTSAPAASSLQPLAAGTQQQTPPDLWGGVECTIVRLKDGSRSQLRETGHSERAGDIDLIAGLGVRTVRYPVLWEAVTAREGAPPDFDWTDQRLGALRDRGIRVIAGLVHHGSGPPWTNLLDPDFPEKLAAYALRVAERYPWIDMWTPVNEPLTTARFSALYGHWYPHRRDYPSFLRATVNQCRGTALAMQAIRSVSPRAQLVQTEDLGKTFSTAPLRHQAAHENTRRWLSLDLLCGGVGRRHPWWKILRDNGIAKEELAELATGAGRPDIIGINHYLTSERFLDHRTGLYPDELPGGNGRQVYVDAEAVRVKRLSGETGLAPRLREAWQRYRLPLAVTEVHHGCSRDEQLRWLAEVWESAKLLRSEGIDLRAVTVWSLFGAVDWRSLLTERKGLYDVGAFDARRDPPRPTVLARAATSYARGETFDHPVLDRPGWWRRPARLYPWNGQCRSAAPDGRKLLVTGATGTLGRAFARICEERGLPFCPTGRDELDICDPDMIARAMERHRPWAVINAAGFVRVADAARERDACFAWNADGPENLARACEAAGIPLVTFSSDLVFDGRLGRPCLEDDLVSPLCAYGQSKAEAERRVLSISPKALVVRTAALFGPWDIFNFAHQTAQSLARGRHVHACPNSIVSPTWVPDLVHATLDLLIDGESGIWHLANQGALSWHGFAQLIAERMNCPAQLVIASPERPARITALGSSRGALMRPLADAIDEFVMSLSRGPPDLNAIAAE